MTLVAELLASPYLLEGVAVTLAVIFLSGYYGDFAEGFPYSNVPSVGWDRWALTNRKAKQRFVTSSRALIKEGFDQVRLAAHLSLAVGCWIQRGGFEKKPRKTDIIFSPEG